MSGAKQVLSIAGYNFRLWRRNPRIIVTFLLAFVLTFMLTDKVVSFALDHKTTLQLTETFIWSFGDSNSILLTSVLLALLFADMPFLSAGTPFFLVRTSRRKWIAGQVVYVLLATTLYMAFVFLCTIAFAGRISFPANMWSPTAAILSYGGGGDRIQVPVLIKTLEMSRPYPTMAAVFLLMLGYSLVMVMLMLALNLRFGQTAGVVGVFAYSLFGFLLEPGTIHTFLNLPNEAFYLANVAVGWLSPLNQATFSMHNFGYDRLPRLWQSYAIFGAAVLLLTVLSVRAAKKHNFTFTGTEG